MRKLSVIIILLFVTVCLATPVVDYAPLGTLTITTSGASPAYATPVLGSYADSFLPVQVNSSGDLILASGGGMGSSAVVNREPLGKLSITTTGESPVYATPLLGMFGNQFIPIQVDSSGNVIASGGGGGGGVTTIGTIDSQSKSADGAVISTTNLYMQTADATHPGLMSSGTQTIAGAKTFSGAISASNLSGTNTGDVTLGAVGASPSANGASLSSQVLTLQPADATHPGVLTAANFNTFNGKQAAGSYITALTGDVTASGPGSVAAVLGQTPRVRYIDLSVGSDSTGNGSLLKPWKTIQKGYNSVTPTNAEPYVLYITGQGSPDVSSITAKPNVSLISAQPIEISVSFTITGGDNVAREDDAIFENIYFASFTWSKNDNHNVVTHFYDSSIGGGFVLKNVGSGLVEVHGLNTIFINSEFRAYLGAFVGCTFAGTAVFDDTVSAASFTTYQFSGGYSNSQMTFIGGSSVYFGGNIQDENNGATLTVTTTASGAANLVTDSSGPTSVITGAPTFTYLSLAQYEGYTPASPGKWAGSPPTTVQEAIDRIAAVVGNTIPIP